MGPVGSQLYSHCLSYSLLFLNYIHTTAEGNKFIQVFVRFISISCYSFTHMLLVCRESNVDHVQ